jgi:hypothetical protein
MSGNYTDVETNLVAGKIKVNKMILGVAGIFTGTSFNWGSGAHRDKSATAMSYEQEKNLTPTASFASDYHPIPKIDNDKDVDVYSPGVNPPVTLVDRSSWNSTTCGVTSGNSIDQRIVDCQTILGSSATWTGTTYGNAGQSEWKLVARSNCSGSSCAEVWKDISTGLLWSSKVSTSAGTNWCKASGNNNSSKVTLESFKEDDPSMICTNSQNQSTDGDPISACLENSVFNNTDTSLSQSGKSGLNSSLTANGGRVIWRLPTIYDYILANHNGLRFVMPDVSEQGKEWTATTYSLNRTIAWIFDMRLGQRSVMTKTQNLNVRCVGR